MRLALLGAAAALSLAGIASAQAETVYLADPYVATAPGYVYSAPAPLSSPGYVVSEPGYRVVAPPQTVVVAPPAPVGAPMVVAPQTYVAPAAPPAGGIVTTGFATTPSCFIDWRGIERCY
jgi:hypothetical protein